MILSEDEVAEITLVLRALEKRMKAGELQGHYLGAVTYMNYIARGWLRPWVSIPARPGEIDVHLTPEQSKLAIDVGSLREMVALQTVCQTPTAERAPKPKTGTITFKVREGNSRWRPGLSCHGPRLAASLIFLQERRLRRDPVTSRI